MKNKLNSVKLRTIAILKRLNLLKYIKLNNNIMFNSTETTVDIVVSFIFPIAPNEGQPMMTAGKSKNKIGISRRNIFAAGRYFSPPKINIPKSARK